MSTNWRESSPEEILNDLQFAISSIKKQSYVITPDISIYNPSIFRDPLSKALGFTHYVKNNKLYRR